MKACGRKPSNVGNEHEYIVIVSKGTQSPINVSVYTLCTDTQRTCITQYTLNNLQLSFMVSIHTHTHGGQVRNDITQVKQKRFPMEIRKM